MVAILSPDPRPPTPDPSMPRVLLLATTTGYQVRSFGAAARRCGIELVLGTDRCTTLDDPWQDAALPIRFHEADDSVATIVSNAREHPIDGVVAVGDRPTVIAALAAAALGLAGHPPAAVRRAGNKRLTRESFAGANLPSPWFRSVSLDHDECALAMDVRYPCVLKPLALSGSRGVIRANDAEQFGHVFRRIRRLLRQRDIRSMRDVALDEVLVEGYVEGNEFAVEGIVDHGRFRVLAIFEKPEPLDGPFFEETVYVTPPRLADAQQSAVVEAVAAAARCLGLEHGPVHAECRVHADRVVVLEVAARPIGGLCATALRFENAGGQDESLEGLLLRHAAGESVDAYRRESRASGVMMIPIPSTGRLKGASGIATARTVAGVDDIVITAKPDQLLVPLPEGGSYLGFIFARAPTPDAAVEALRSAHQRLHFEIETQVPVV